MSAIKTIPQLTMALQVMYARYNTHCFGSALPSDCVISLEPSGKRKAYGWFTTCETWETTAGKAFGIVIAQDFLDRGELNVEITLIHEMCHLYAQIKGIQDTSRSGKYHNDKFREIAEKAGLICTKEPGNGWATREMGLPLREWRSENSIIQEIDLQYIAPDLEKPKQKGGKKSGFFKYVCPTCGKTARTTTELFLSCGGTVNAVHAPVDMELD